jgi:NAD(P)-dependent dehydrogenase (short-subunit alcohol dehydrogenase family)
MHIQVGVEETMATSWFDLSGRRALVTGAGKGLGRSIALALARAGADVGVVSRTKADLEAVATEVRDLGRRASVIVADMGDEASIGAMTEQAIRELGGIDILVNNAGIEGLGAVVEMEAEAWDWVMAVNLRAPMLCCKHVGPHMIAQRRGKVINVASVMATAVSRYMSSYAAAKAGLVQLTRTLALEWMRHNIQVNALCPGYFLTPMNEEFFATETGRRLVESLPSRRLGDPAELQGAAVFLASDATSFVTGTTLYVDGGHSLK